MMSREIKMLIFSIGDQFYSGDIMEVERILTYEEPTKLPDSPDFLKGVINYEGNILPVISLSDRFHKIPNDSKENLKIIVTRQGEKKIGVIVDSVSEVKPIMEDQIEDAPDIASQVSKRYIKGLIKEEERIIVFLTLGSILSEEEKQLV
ncbi:MAG: purine-binding chemotaxis protein CheW [Clostridium argentinense]|uniref:Purine-binding chemotaxis protein CheW n=1 Tax=Clostridium faecium TaxID=2762223 RepID=A0ABR8YNZ7_9CLOT|nr:MULTISPECIES: chemotaxis protein CheW [Clostridium]MBD8045976.1 purine-binding chemotaxis protein CheW [Clostridium faecium]MBS5823931.1 purine-binding chemotaxis protein CheW [Clostridium argentinense]MDU1349526.1 chemotaxis protein CheW [Clostridium argentinense]